MNFYNPYFTGYPYSTIGNTTRTGLFSRLFGNDVNFSSILSGTQKTLNVVNQTIPLIKQAQPMFRNAKTMFKLMNEFKKVDTPVADNSNKQIEQKKNVENSYTYNNGPTFFI
jgi:hypothetical protein